MIASTSAQTPVAARASQTVTQGVTAKLRDRGRGLTHDKKWMLLKLLPHHLTGILPATDTPTILK